MHAQHTPIPQTLLVDVVESLLEYGLCVRRCLEERHEKIRPWHARYQETHRFLSLEYRQVVARVQYLLWYIRYKKQEIEPGNTLCRFLSGSVVGVCCGVASSELLSLDYSTNIDSRRIDIS